MEKHGQHFSHIGNRNFLRTAVNGRSRPAPSLGVESLKLPQKYLWKISKKFVLKTLSLCYFNIFYFCLVWSLTGKTLLVTVCTLARWAEPACRTFWETRIPVSDIAPSSPAALLLGRWQYSLKYHKLWWRHFFLSAVSELLMFWTSFESKYCRAHPFHNCPSIDSYSVLTRHMVGYIRGFLFQGETKSHADHSIIPPIQSNPLLCSVHPFLMQCSY